MTNQQSYELIVGLEIHIQLNTKTKMFSGVSNEMWQDEPNSHVSPVDLGLPGALPVPNVQAIKFTQRFGHALHCTLATESKFDRKNYFYPDLPKGYQITQYDQPFCSNGFLDIPTAEGGTKRITIRRIHLEEDTGKSLHKNGNTYLDYNKSGVPLVELVTEPDFRSAEEASEFSKMIQVAVRTLRVSDADMEKGNMRLEANVSVRKIGETNLPPYRVELKNINSFKFLRDAISYEFERQVDCHEEGTSLYMETRGWDSKNGVSILQRRKETESDYRYFPEPDIPPFKFDDAYVASVTEAMPVMPWDTEREIIARGVRADYAHTLAYDSESLSIFQKYDGELSPQDVAKIIVNTNDLSTIAEVFAKQSQKSTIELLSESELEVLVRDTIAHNELVVNDYRAGKSNAIQFLVGQIMKASQGKVDAFWVRKKLEEMLVI